MNINEKKEKLLKKEINVSDLTSDEVNEIKKIVEKDLVSKKEELKNINIKIKQMKTTIDNWAN